MRKILTLISVLSLVSFNSYAVDVSQFSVTAGVALIIVQCTVRQQKKLIEMSRMLLKQ